jgi:surface antigen
MRKMVTLVAALIATVGLVGGLSSASTPDATIKKVMKEAMKGGLCKKVASGKAEAADKEALLKHFKDMAAATPPAGDDASWKEKTAALVTGAQAAVDGKENAGALILKAANCKACHDVHK